MLCKMPKDLYGINGRVKLETYGMHLSKWSESGFQLVGTNSGYMPAKSKSNLFFRGSAKFEADCSHSIQVGDNTQ